MTIPSEYLPQSVPDEIMPPDDEIEAMMKDVAKLIEDNFHMSFEMFATGILIQQIKEADEAAERRFKEFLPKINWFGEITPRKAILQDVISDYASASVEVRGRWRDYKSSLDLTETPAIPNSPSFGGRMRPQENDSPSAIISEDKANTIRSFRAKTKVKLLGGICRLDFTINTLNLIMPDGKKIDSPLNGVANQIAEALPPLFFAKLKEVFKSMLSASVREVYDEIMQDNAEQLNRIETKVGELHKAAHIRGGRPRKGRAKYTQRDIAEMIGRNEDTIRRWENGESKAPPGYSRELRESGTFEELVAFVSDYKAMQRVKDALNSKHVVRNMSEEQMYRESLK